MHAASLRSLAGLAFMPLLLCGVAGEGVAQPVPASAAAESGAAGIVSPIASPSGPIRFDIPSQPLHEALQQYSSVTGRSLLYDSKAVLGRTSAPLIGLYTPQDALQLLIAGSGMTARYTSAEAFMLVPQAAEPVAATPQESIATPEADLPGGDQLAREHYFGWMQARMMEALCADPATAPGSYRLALRFRIDAGNAVRQLEIHATGHPGLAARVRRRLDGLDLGAAPPPPPQLQQPVTLLILPTTGAAC
jgi:hypothetical protein